jgi:peptidoglycan hydrolase CwlO-like protein
MRPSCGFREGRARQEAERTTRALQTTVETLQSRLATADAARDELERKVTALRAESSWRQDVEANLKEEIDRHSRKSAELERRLEAEHARAAAAEAAAFTAETSGNPGVESSR